MVTASYHSAMSSTDLTPQPPDRSQGSLFDHSIPSLSASLAAFGNDPESSVHSGFSTRSPMFSSRYSVDESEPESEGPWAPPAWQKSNTGWYRKSLMGDSAVRSSPSRSRGASPLEAQPGAEREITPSHIPLPESPLKGSPRTSPEPVDFRDAGRVGRHEDGERGQTPAYSGEQEGGAEEGQEEGAPLDGCEFWFFGR